ncbi:hypothetical protein MZO42_17645 [Sphingomonas psychrotolerans]|uniref:Uncharacterized protein n=1 Tax=Sphingomonas psychrotolerans TaxID=1327635 RepID=A0ABU3N7N1_9SPHN|nr:hypothetical protein [Sphingomonas psychrotolerans]MDT8760528.1 hypothetical protein [Sphingomonas psychrotolerans]
MFIQPSPASASIEFASGATGQFNSIALTPAQFGAALQVLAMLPAIERVDPRAQAKALQAYARGAGFTDEALAGAALHARVTALARWTAAHDPLRQSDPQAVIEAAARHHLVGTDCGVGFEGASFQELILFIEELPW